MYGDTYNNDENRNGSSYNDSYTYVSNSQSGGPSNPKPGDPVNSQPGDPVNSQPGGPVNLQPGGPVNSQPDGPVNLQSDGPVNSQPGGRVNSQPSGSANIHPNPPIPGSANSGQTNNNAEQGRVYPGQVNISSGYVNKMPYNSYTGYTGNSQNSSGMHYSNGYNPYNRYANTGNNIHKQEDKPKAKKGGFFKRAAVITVSALAFGCIAGFAMYGVNNAISSNRNAAIAQADTSSDAAKETTNSTVTTKTAIDNTTAASGTYSAGNAKLLDVSGIVEKAMPSIVAVNGTATVTSSDFFGQQQTYEAKASGSGIIIGENDTEYLVVTNNHVVEDTKKLEVTFIDDTSVSANVKGRDADSDIALLAIKKSDVSEDTKSSIIIATMGDSDSLKVGEGVVAIGNALGYGQSVTVGYISAQNRDLTTSEGSTVSNLLQTDAAINPGNSGGALLDMNGNVIGINAAKYSSTEVEGMGYAIPISKVSSIISDLSSKTTRIPVDENERGYIGIQGQNVSAEMANSYGIPEGVYVYQILSDGGAAESELQEKDIITKIEGQRIKTLAELQDILSTYSGGDTVTLTVERLENKQYTEKDIEIKLKTQEDSNMISSGSENRNSEDYGNSQNEFNIFNNY